MVEAVIVALFDKFDSAKRTSDELVEIGTPKNRIGILANNTAGDHPGVLTNPSFARPAIDDEIASASETGPGIAIGAGVGGVAGVLFGAGSLVIPGIGPALAIGAWVATAAGIGAGAVVGGLIGSLIDYGVPVQDAELYAEGLRRGATLVSVRAPKEAVEGVSRIFANHGAVDIEKRAASWRAEGWVGFDRQAQPLSAAELNAIRQRQAGHEVAHHRAIRSYFIPAEPERLAGISNQTTHYAEDMLGD